MDYSENYPEEKDTYKDSGKIRIGKIIGRVFKWLAILIIVGVYAILFFRMYFFKVPSKFTEFVWTDEALAAYRSDESFELVTQEPYESIDDDGYYQISDVWLCRAAGELQLTVRYNSRSTINTLMDKYMLAERPTGETFVYMLRDQNGKTYTDYRFASETRPMNEFRRLIFDGVDFTGVTTLYLDVYYGNDVSDLAPMNVTFIVYENDRTEFVEKFKEPSPTKLKLSDSPAYINNLSE